MDLKSMLNDSSAQRQPPRLHTPQSSFDQAAERTPVYDHPSERHHPASHPAQPQHSHSHSESRSPQGPGYFMLQSPYHHSNSASTPTGSAQPVYVQSPGPAGQSYNQRDSVPPPSTHHVNYAVSPSQPPTPGSLHQYPHHSPRPAAYSHPTAGQTQRQSTRDELMTVNGHPHLQHRQTSPAVHFHPPPAAPLGPPAHPKQSPHVQRPVSRGFEGHRKSSFGSVGSTQSRDPSIHQSSNHESVRGSSAQRTYSTEEENRRERERSLDSVSPKTIPKPSPQRQSSSSYQQSQTASPHHPEPPHIHVAQPSPHDTSYRNMELHNNGGLSRSAEPPGMVHMPLVRPSPPTKTNSSITQSSLSSLPPQPSPAMKQNSLKRDASAMSGSSTPATQPRKRLRRDEIPIFAQSARRGRPLRLDMRGPISRPPKDQNAATKEPVEKRAINGQPAQRPPPQQPAAAPPQPQVGLPDDEKWEPSILNQVPYEDLTRTICDWIYGKIGEAAPPAGGAVFEIEAKVGAIVEVDEGQRLRLPVTTETVFNKDAWRRTKFESTMNMAQHKQLNAFLNDQVQRSFAEAQSSNREVIRPSHPKESDEFFNLTSEGRQQLPQSIAHWLNPRHTPRVRRTIDTTTGQLKAQIIKSRIADIEIFNPRADFDYRISVSIESPWEGNPQHLLETTDGGGDRKKDRMSYRHMAYQIDLTQISHANSKQLEHELEVEISTELIRSELDNLRMQRPSRYEDLVRGFLDNVRILCRRGTVGAQI